MSIPEAFKGAAIEWSRLPSTKARVKYVAQTSRLFVEVTFPPSGSTVPQERACGIIILKYLSHFCDIVCMHCYAIFSINISHVIPRRR